jgi:hypothetical protein
MRITYVVGARPNIVKMALVLHAVRRRGADTIERHYGAAPSASPLAEASA